jgi:hypothetical protein
MNSTERLKAVHDALALVTYKPGWAFDAYFLRGNLYPEPELIVIYISHVAQYPTMDDLTMLNMSYVLPDHVWVAGELQDKIFGLFVWSMVRAMEIDEGEKWFFYNGEQFRPFDKLVPAAG